MTGKVQKASVLRSITHWHERYRFAIIGTVSQNLSDFISVLSVPSVLYCGFGIVQVGLFSHDPSQNQLGFLTLAAVSSLPQKEICDAYYRLKGTQLSNGHTWHFRYANLKEVQTDE